MASEHRTIDMASLADILARFSDVDGALLPIVHAVQEEFGYIPPEAVEEIAKFLHATSPQVYATITFYSEFRTKPRGGTIIGVCRGPACRLRGAGNLQHLLERRLGIRSGETTPDRRVTLETVSCLGICGLAPAIEVGHDLIGRADDSAVEAVAASAIGETGLSHRGET